MHALLERIPDTTIESLRDRAAMAEMLVLPADTSRPLSARAANEAFHARQRELGGAEMHALLAATGLHRPLTEVQIHDVLLAAIDLFLRTSGIEAETTMRDGTVTVTITRCPVFDHFGEASWHGITACGCFARRQGWYDALGAPVSELLVMNRKWDDPVCRTEIQICLSS